MFYFQGFSGLQTPTVERYCREVTLSKLSKNMAQVPTLLMLSTFAWGLALGVITMFTLEHGNYLQFAHEYVEKGYNTNTEIKRNLSKYKDHADNFLKQNRTTQEQAKSPRILCWIMTDPTNMPTRAKSVKDTWGKRCDILLFFSSKADPSFPAIGLDVTEGASKLFDKTRASLDYIFQHHLNNADWFLKADDDTYVIIENLRHMLSKLNTSDPHYLGRRWTHRGGFNSGAGYIFSRETLRRFKKALEEPSCPQHYEFEDVAVGICLRAQGVQPADNTRDSNGREQIMPLPLEQHLLPGRSPGWYPRFYKEGPECCSYYPSIFHVIKPDMMYQLEYFIYRVKIWT